MVGGYDAPLRFLEPERYATDESHCEVGTVRTQPVIQLASDVLVADGRLTVCDLKMKLQCSHQAAM